MTYRIVVPMRYRNAEEAVEAAFCEAADRWYDPAHIRAMGRRIWRGESERRAEKWRSKQTA